MTITFPHIGDAHIYVKLLCNETGVSYITPTLNSSKVLEIGAAEAPDEICLPFKFMIANFMDAYERGADTAVMPATMGPCRLGEYAELFKSILDKKGYVFQWIVVDSANEIGVRELLKRLGLIISERSVSKVKVFRTLVAIHKVISNVEEIERYAYKMSPYEIEKGAHKNALQQCKKELEKVQTIKNANKVLKSFKKNIHEIEKDMTKTPVRIILTGEIYTLIEPCANHNIEYLLMDMGVSFIKRITIGWWIHRILVPFSLTYAEKKKEAYLSYNIGGYAKDTVKEAHLCQKEKYDGIIQILPSGCMPEIVAKSIFSRIAEEQNLNILTVIFDELTGEAGYLTRIEAYIDMMVRRKNHVLFGN